MFPKPLERILKEHALAFFVGIAILAAGLFLLEEVTTPLFTTFPLMLQGFFEELGAAKYALFLLLYIVLNLFSLPSHFFVFMSGVIFGFQEGVILSLIGEFCSASLNYKIGKTFKVPKTKRFLEAKKYIALHGESIVLALRYLGVFFDAVSYAAGAAKIRYTKFIGATMVGFLPHILLYAFVGSLLATYQSTFFLYPLLVIKLCIILSFFIGIEVWRLSTRS